MLVCYNGGSGLFNNELLICEIENEETLIRDYFTNADRDLDNYDRSIIQGVLQIVPQTRVIADNQAYVDLPNLD